MFTFTLHSRIVRHSPASLHQKNRRRPRTKLQSQLYWPILGINIHAHGTSSSSHSGENDLIGNTTLHFHLAVDIAYLNEIRHVFTSAGTRISSGLYISFLSLRPPLTRLLYVLLHLDNTRPRSQPERKSQKYIHNHNPATIQK